MPTTILPKKTLVATPIATDDEHHALLVADPTVPQFSATMNTIQPAQPTQPAYNPTQAGSNAAQDAEVLVKNDNSDWINKKWRPLMGYMYMAVCTADFIVFPVLWSLLQAMSKGQVTNQWNPLTLQGAGLFHISMGAILGIAAYGRTKEKLEGKQ